MRSDCNIVVDSSFEERMNNWRRTVVYSVKRKGSCAWWADIYVGSNRHKWQNEDEAPHSIYYVDYLDGWRVEQAWKTLENINEKMILKYWFVFQYSEHQIKRKLLIRRKGIRELLTKARINLQKELDKLAKSNSDK